MIAVPGVLALVLGCLGLGMLIGSFAGSKERPDEWARTNGLTLDDTTRPVLAVYLRNTRWLRRIGALGGLVLPVAITAGTGLDVHTNGIIWILLGYLLGQVAAELTLARVPATAHRSASLGVRRVASYLPRPLATAQVLLPLVAVGLGVVVVRAAPDGSLPGELANQAMSTASSAAPLALVVLVLALVAERQLVRRPQPIVDPELVALDDAMRSSSVRVVAATGVAIVALLVALQVSALSTVVEGGAVQSALWATGSLVMLAAWLSWQWWVNRGWRVRRPGSPVGEAVA